MYCCRLEGRALASVKNLIPAECYPLIRSGAARVIGVRVFEEIQGVLVWRPPINGEKVGRILSIYVAPLIRRIGVGGELLSGCLRDMETFGVENVEVTFSPEGDEWTLVPFLENMDFQLDREEFPVADQPITEVVRALKQREMEKSDLCGISIAELDRDSRRTAAVWLSETHGEDLTAFEGNDPPSFVVMEEGQVSTILLASREESVISVDYLYQRRQDPKELIGLLYHAVSTVSASYPEDTRIQMLLVSERSQKICEALFGEPEDRQAVFHGRMF